jgi:hypothetical protein
MRCLKLWNLSVVLCGFVAFTSCERPLPPQGESETEAVTDPVDPDDPAAASALLDLGPKFKAANLLELDFSSTTAGSADMVHLEGLKNLKRLVMMGPNFDSTALEHAKDLTTLEFLVVENTAVDDKGVEAISGLTELIVLNLRRTAVTDAALENLKDMKKLKDLDLRFNDYITDDGMKSLQNLPSLRYLKLEKTKVGDAGMQEIGKLKQLLRQAQTAAAAQPQQTAHRRRRNGGAEGLDKHDASRLGRYRDHRRRHATFGRHEEAAFAHGVPNGCGRRGSESPPGQAGHGTAQPARNESHERGPRQLDGSVQTQVARLERDQD